MQEEDKFFADLIANDEVEDMPLDACTAASLGHIEQLTRYAAGELDSTNRSGWTPLMYAACLGHTTTVQYLGRRRVSSTFYAKDEENFGRQQTALMLAAANGNDEPLQALLSLPDSRANAADNRGWTALFYAIFYGHPSTAEILLKNGADPNVTEKNRLSTPLIVAAEAGHDDIIRILLRYGADPNRKTSDGSSAIDLASGRGHAAAVRILNLAISKAAKSPPMIPLKSGASPSTTSTLSVQIDDEMTKLLQKLNLQHYAKDFSASKISFKALMAMSEDDLRQLPFLTVGARKQIMLVIKEQQPSPNQKETPGEPQSVKQDAEVLLRNREGEQNVPLVFSHFLGHIAVLVNNCQLLDNNQKRKLSDVVNQSIKNVSRASQEQDVSLEIDKINSYFDAYLAQN